MFDFFMKTLIVLFLIITLGDLFILKYVMFAGTAIGMHVFLISAM